MVLGNDKGIVKLIWINKQKVVWFLKFKKNLRKVTASTTRNKSNQQITNGKGHNTPLIE